MVDVVISDPGGIPVTIIGPLDTCGPACLGTPVGEPFKALTKLILGFEEIVGPGALILCGPGPCTIMFGCEVIIVLPTSLDIIPLVTTEVCTTPLFVNVGLMEGTPPTCALTTFIVPETIVEVLLA